MLYDRATDVTVRGTLLKTVLTPTNCFNCGKEGHIQRECTTSDHEIFGDYVHEIREGRQAEMENPENKQEVSDINKNLNPVFEMKSSPSSSSQTVILGASNCTRIIIDDPNIHNLSVSGTTLDNVQSLLNNSNNEVKADFVKKVILSVGTNDISKHKNDVEQVNVNFTMCIETAKQKYPFAKIGIVVFCLEEAKVSTSRLQMQQRPQSILSLGNYAKKYKPAIH